MASVDDTIETRELHLWLDRTKEGDLSALDELFRRVSSRLERIARNMLKRFSRLERWTDAEDIVQSAALRLIRALKEIRPESKRDFYALAATQIRREALDLTRSLYGEHGIGANHDSICGRNDDSRQGWDPPSQMDQAELDRWVAFHEQVEKLPTDEREVVGLYFYHGWSQAEIAELFQVTTKTIQRRWQSALSLLRENLCELPMPDRSE
jgi:RNA polymerase sigma factor (sigma-70 family)